MNADAIALRGQSVLWHNDAIALQKNHSTNKHQEIVDYLLKKDPVRYGWAKSYLKNPKDKG